VPLSNVTSAMNRLIRCTSMPGKSGEVKSIGSVRFDHARSALT
jgi:hypothetical protein